MNEIKKNDYLAVDQERVHQANQPDLFACNVRAMQLFGLITQFQQHFDCADCWQI